MSIFNTVEAVPNRLSILFDVLRNAEPEGVDRKQLQKMISPASLRASEGGSPNIFNRSLKAFCDSGFAEIDSGKVCLAKPFQKQKKESDNIFIEVAQALLLDPTLDPNKDSVGLAVAISWFLCHAPTKPFSWDSAPTDELRKDFETNGPDFDLTNKERWQTFAYWARYLGFAKFWVSGKDNFVIPDPTIAVDRLLTNELPKKKEIPVESVLNALISAVSIFEGGKVRTLIEGQFQNKPVREKHCLSASTIFALQRLELANKLKLIHRDDAQPWMATGILDGRMTHIKLT